MLNIAGFGGQHLAAADSFFRAEAEAWRNRVTSVPISADVITNLSATSDPTNAIASCLAKRKSSKNGVRVH